MAKKDESNPLDTFNTDMKNYWEQAKKETRERKAPDEHWIWTLLFAILLIVLFTQAPRLIVEFCDWINYNHPL